MNKQNFLNTQNLFTMFVTCKKGKKKKKCKKKNFLYLKIKNNSKTKIAKLGKKIKI